MCNSLIKIRAALAIAAGVATRGSRRPLEEGAGEGGGGRQAKKEKQKEELVHNTSGRGEDEKKRGGGSNSLGSRGEIGTHFATGDSHLSRLTCRVLSEFPRRLLLLLLLPPSPIFLSSRIYRDPELYDRAWGNVSM